MGGGNLEVFKFGMYIMFPIGMMYYFGTNLDNRFSVPDFWPKPEETHRIPFEREDQKKELDRLRALRLALRDKKRLAEQQGIDLNRHEHEQAQLEHPKSEILEATKLVEPLKPEMSREGNWGSLLSVFRKQG